MKPEDEGRRIADRAIRYRGQLAGVAAQAMIEGLVENGTYASKGAARRALGINSDPLPPTSGWFTRLISGLAGTHPKPPNA